MLSSSHDQDLSEMPAIYYYTQQYVHSSDVLLPLFSNCGGWCPCTCATMVGSVIIFIPCAPSPLLDKKRWNIGLLSRCRLLVLCTTTFLCMVEVCRWSIHPRSPKDERCTILERSPQQQHQQRSASIENQLR